MAGHISKRGKDTWRVRITLGSDTDGKRESKNWTVHGSKKDAERLLTEKLRERDRGVLISPSDASLDDYLNRWLAESAKPRLSAATFENYEYLLKLYVRPRLGKRKLSDLKLHHMQSLSADLTADGKSARTVRYALNILSGAFRYAIKKGILAVNPCTGVDLPRLENREMKAFTPEEGRRFLEACKGDRLGLVFAVALASGMRPEEYLGLKWSDVDLEKYTLTVQRVLIRSKMKGGGWHFDKPKTGKSRRSMPMPPAIMAELKVHRTDQLKSMMTLGSEYERHDLVFTNEFGRPLDLKNIRTRNFARILKAAGLDSEFRVYDLRHSMATIMLANGENPKIVSERLGHASITLTMDTYSHVLPGIQEAATDRLGKVLFG